MVIICGLFTIQPRFFVDFAQSAEKYPAPTAGEKWSMFCFVRFAQKRRFAQCRKMQLLPWYGFNRKDVMIWAL